MGTYAKARLFNVALPAANTNLLSQDITMAFDLTQLRIHIATTKQGKLSMKRTEIVTGITITEALSTTNQGADEGWTYIVPTRAISKFNFTYSATGGTILVFQVDEVE
jgi:hypothetical protein